MVEMSRRLTSSHKRYRRDYCRQDELLDNPRVYALGSANRTWPVRLIGVVRKNGRMSMRRTLAMAAVMGCHIGLFLSVLRPPSWRESRAPVYESDVATLDLHFIAQPISSPTPPKSHEAQQLVRRQSLKQETNVLPLQRRRRDATQIATPLATPGPSGPSSPPLPVSAPDTTGEVSAGDGGFHDRLLNAQRFQSAKGIPGSDTRLAPGLQLTDPMNQGVGAVMRSTQRLFGITDRHCIDVEVWASLSPEALSDRHLTLADVRAEGERYHCNQPLGLSF